MTTSKMALKAKRPRKPKTPKVWTEETTSIDSVKLTEPEEIFAQICRISYPYLHSRLTRSNVPYRGTDYKSDFTIFEHCHPFWHGIVIEVQGGIYARHRSGHSSSKGLVRDYMKATVAQRNHWLIVQIPPDIDSLAQYAKVVNQIIMQFDEETEENEAQLRKIEGTPVNPICGLVG